MDRKIRVISYAEMTLKLPPERRVSSIAIADNEVPLHGEGLSEIWWRGKQWAATQYGIECLDGTYTIEKASLLKGNPDIQAMLPNHMSEKEWVDIDEFTTAWMIGLLLHGHGGKIAPDLLLKIFRRLPPRQPIPV